MCRGKRKRPIIAPVRTAWVSPCARSSGQTGDTAVGGPLSCPGWWVARRKDPSLPLQAAAATPSGGTAGEANDSHSPPLPSPSACPVECAIGEHAAVVEPGSDAEPSRVWIRGMVTRREYQESRRGRRPDDGWGLLSIGAAAVRGLSIRLAQTTDRVGVGTANAATRCTDFFLRRRLSARTL
ncbi:hypothetical protein AcV7_009500 [Taiwanofungus camphoratus]|nr:hypothetical protein AcV7_009500 [Antrodia cinnamomea]